MTSAWYAPGVDISIPFGAGPNDPHLFIGSTVPPELAAYYLANHAATFVSVYLEYFGGTPNSYHYRAVSNAPTTGQIQIAEGYVVWNAGVPIVVPDVHYFRPSNDAVSNYPAREYDPDIKGSVQTWSPQSTFPYAVITEISPNNVVPMVGRTGGPVQPMSIVTMDYLTPVPDLTLTSADQIVAGTLSFQIEGLSAGLGGIMVTAFLDIDVTVAAAGQRVVGTLYRDGAAIVVPLATFSQAAVGRATVGMSWRYEPGDTNSHTFDLYARKTGAGGTAIVRANGTRLWGMKFDPMRTL